VEPYLLSNYSHREAVLRDSYSFTDSGITYDSAASTTLGRTKYAWSVLGMSHIPLQTMHTNQHPAIYMNETTDAKNFQSINK
jgi:hypothetical protein